MKLLRRFRRRGKVLAVKLGYNPNSSSLGADVTFLILGASAIAILGPVVAVAVRLAWRGRAAPGAESAPPAAEAAEPGSITAPDDVRP